MFKSLKRHHFLERKPRTLSGGNKQVVAIGNPSTARFTRKSLNNLNLDIGSKVYAMIKAVAIDRRTLGTSLATSSSETKLKNI